jgi:hypothetical protein
MADVTIVAADVRPLEGCIIRRFTSGDTIGMGQPVYLSAADTVSLADGSAVTTSFAIGVAVATPDGGSSAVSGEAVDVVIAGPVAGYSTGMAYNTLFYVDNDAGVIADATGTARTIIGIGLSASVLHVHPIWVTLT